MGGKSSKAGRRRSRSSNKERSRSSVSSVRSVTSSAGSATSITDPQFRVTVAQLRALMEERGDAGRRKLESMGGINKLCDDIVTSPTTGLIGSKKDIEKRRQVYGRNVIPPRPSKSFLRLLWDALQDTTLFILLVCAFISLSLSLLMPDTPEDEESEYGWVEGVGILICVMVVIFVSAINDWSKERQFRNLQKKVDTDHTFSVMRRGVIEDIHVDDIVVGDLCMLKYGDLIPADGVIIQSSELKVDESSLTGESDLVVKSASSDPMLLSGTNIMQGSAKMLVVGVGLNSQTGIVMGLLVNSKPTENEENKSHGVTEASILQAKLTMLAIYIGYIGSSVAVLTIIILLVQYSLVHFEIRKETMNWSHAENMVRILIVGITIIVLAVPEGLPLAVTLALAYSVRRMMKENNLVRHLHACETMGNATTICSDKTGTLTTNRMTVVQSYICEMLRRITPVFSEIPGDVAYKIAQNISINSGYTSMIVKSDVPGELPKQIGNKTECALLDFADRMGIDYHEIRDREPEEGFIHVYTFSSNRKNMSTVIRHRGDGYRVLTKGAAEVILEKCRWIYGFGGSLVALNSTIRERIIEKVVVPMTNEGLRCITLAYRDFVTTGPVGINETLIRREPLWETENAIANFMTLLCVVGIQDPVRNEVPKAVALCQRAGVTVRMVTGDNINTARAIAQKCGIVHAGDDSLVLDSKMFNERIRDSTGKIKQDLFDKVWPELRVLARSTPTDKYNLVRGIIESKATGGTEVVAVTGDGTNDAPALKRADVGFAMGIAGTDVAKQASDIIITDDNFYSIVRAVLWGRNVYDNICKFLQFQLTVNISAILIAFVGACAIQLTPLRALQMLWINLVMNTVASLALACEYPPPSLLDRLPYGRNKPLISVFMLRIILGQAIYIMSVCFVLLFVGEKFLDVPSGRKSHTPTEHFTVIFNSFTFMTLCNEVVCRKVHGERNVFRGLSKNRVFFVVWILSACAQALIVQFGGIVFHTSPLRWDLWMWCLGFGLSIFLWHQFILCIPVDYYDAVSFWELVSLEEEAHFLAAEWFPEFAQEGLPAKKILYLRGTARLEYQMGLLKRSMSTRDQQASVVELDDRKRDNIEV